MDEPKTILVVGRFPGLKRQDIVDRLTWNGHIVTKSVTAADLVLAGSGTSRSLEAAQRRGLPIYPGDALERIAPRPLPSAAEGGAEPLDGLLDLSGAERRAQIRRFVAAPFAEFGWGTLHKLLDLLPEDELPSVVSDIEGDVLRWPHFERRAHSKHLLKLLDEGTMDPRLRLAGAVSLEPVFKERSIEEARRALALIGERLPRIRKLRIGHASGRFAEWRALLEPTLLAPFEEFDFMYNGFGADGLRAVLDAMPRHATMLDVRDDRLGAEGARLIAEAGLHRLERLQLYKNDLGDAGLRHLCGEGALPALRYLTVSYNGLSSAAGRILARSPLARQLETLKVKYNNLFAAGAAALAAGDWPRLEWLDIGANEIGDDGFVAIVASEGRMGRLRALRLEGNNHNPLVTDVGLKALATSPDLPELERLNIARNHVTHEGMDALLRSPERRSLRILDISGNRLTLAGAAVLGERDLPVALEDLKIDFNDGEEDLLHAQKLMRAPHALHALRKLWISPPWSLRKDSRFVESFLHNPHLEVMEDLYLWYATMSDRAAAQIAQLRLPALRRINFSDWTASEAQLRMIAAAPWVRQLDYIAVTGFREVKPRAERFKSRFEGTTTVCVAY